jgi:hypothetical protein
MQVAFNGKLSLDEYLRAHRLHSKSRNVFIVLGCSLIIIAICLTIVDAEFRHGEVPWIALFIVSYLILCHFYQRYLAKKSWNQYKGIKEPFSGTASDSGIQMSAKYGNASWTWDYFIKYKYSKKLVLLYQAPGLFHVFPRSLFESKTDWSTFVELIKVNISLK